MEDIGEKLKELRKSRRLSIRKVSEASGFSISFLSKLENGKSSITIKNLIKLLSFYGVTLADIFSGETARKIAYPREERKKVDSPESVTLELLVDENKLPVDIFEDTEFSEQFQDRLMRFSAPLSGKEEYIFRNRLIAEEPLTLQDIGDHFGISRERVRQIEKRLLQRLRRFLENELPGYFADGM